MKIGVVDSFGEFQHSFFRDKKIRVHNFTLDNDHKKSIDYEEGNNNCLSHAESVCACILFENPDVEIILYSIEDKDNKYVAESLIHSINDLIEQQVDIINLSLGIEDACPYELESICKKAEMQGTLIIGAHSNSGKIAYPANLHNVIGVSYYETNPQKYVEYNEDTNNIYFFCNYTSLHFMGIRNLVIGTSLLAAKMTGVISKLIEIYPSRRVNELIHMIVDSDINIIIGSMLGYKESYCISDRCNDEMQKLFINQCLNCKKVLDIHIDSEMLSEQLLLLEDGLFVLDIDSYQGWKRNKLNIELIMNAAKEKNFEIYCRRSYCSIYERMNYYGQGIKIVQSFL